MKRASLLAVICLLMAPAFAQQNTGGDSDDDQLSFGFMFQYFNSAFKIHKTAAWRSPFIDPITGLPATDSLNSIGAKRKPGFGLGFVSNLKLGNYADLRFTPGLAFTDKELLYRYRNTSGGGEPIISRVVQSTTFDFPLGLKIKSEQHTNFRAYFLGGIKYSASIVSKKKTDDAASATLDKLLKTNSKALSYEAGIGLDLYFPYFKMSPEIKFSQSIGNVMKREANPYSFPIDKLFLHSLQFSLFFQ